MSLLLDEFFQFESTTSVPYFSVYKVDTFIQFFV